MCNFHKIYFVKRVFAQYIVDFVALFTTLNLLQLIFIKHKQKDGYVQSTRDNNLLNLRLGGRKIKL